MSNFLSIDDVSVQDVGNIFEIANIQTTKVNKNINFLSANLFFENSTRTSLSFLVAAKNLGIKTIDININNLSTSKNETQLDTCNTVSLLGVDFLIIRHPESGFCKLVKNFISNDSCSIINAGDGINEHPTQALTDIYTMLNYKKDLHALKIVMCGDIANSRAAKSTIKLLKLFDAKVFILTPPSANEECQNLGIVSSNIKETLKDADFVLSYRYKKEYMKNVDLSDHYKEYCIKHDLLKLCSKDVLVMHPGPVMRNIDIESSIIDDIKIFKGNEQVKNGVIVRQAVFLWLKNIK